MRRFRRKKEGLNFSKKGIRFRFLLHVYLYKRREAATSALNPFCQVCLYEGKKRIRKSNSLTSSIVSLAKSSYSWSSSIVISASAKNWFKIAKPNWSRGSTLRGSTSVIELNIFWTVPVILVGSSGCGALVVSFSFSSSSSTSSKCRSR